MNFTRRHILGAGAILPLAGCVKPIAPSSFDKRARSPLATALDHVDDVVAALEGKRVAILTHAAGIDQAGRRSIDVLAKVPRVRLTAIWSPEHGLAGAAAAGDHVGDGRDAITGLPVHSLYGARKTPTPAMLAAVDAVFVDLQDVGTRPYTYASTMLEVLKAAAASRTSIFVNDRPNPLGGVQMEGPVLDVSLRSFVGAWPIPLRHGLTFGELARMMNGERLAGSAPIEAALTVLPMHGWRRDRGAEAFGADGLPFLPPSPNLRSLDAILAYAGTVLFEGTSVSEGRGTAAPFLTLCAPFLEAGRLNAQLGPDALQGAILHYDNVVPTAARYAGEPCGAIHIRINEPVRYRPVEAALTLIAALLKIYPDKMRFLEGTPPFFDRLSGDAKLRDALQNGVRADALVQGWQESLIAFAERRKAWLLYG